MADFNEELTKAVLQGLGLASDGKELPSAEYVMALLKERDMLREEVRSQAAQMAALRSTCAGRLELVLWVADKIETTVAPTMSTGVSKEAVMGHVEELREITKPLAAELEMLKPDVLSRKTDEAVRLFDQQKISRATLFKAFGVGEEEK